MTHESWSDFISIFLQVISIVLVFGVAKYSRSDLFK